MKYTLQELHERVKKTHQEVADALGVSRSSYTCYLTGHQRPSLAVAIRLSKYFKVQVQDIIFPIDELEGR